jgi:hypothetical protein
MRIRRDLNRDQFVAKAAATALIVDAARIPERPFRQIVGILLLCLGLATLIRDSM